MFENPLITLSVFDNNFMLIAQKLLKNEKFREFIFRFSQTFPQNFAFFAKVMNNNIMSNNIFV